MPIANITGLDVAFVAAIAAIVGAIAAPFTSYFVTRATNQHRRWEKTYEDRRDALIAILATVEAQRHDTEDLIRFLEYESASASESVTLPSPDEFVRRSAAIGAFAPNDVSAALDDYTTAYDAVVTAGQVATHGEDDTPEHREKVVANLRLALDATAPLRTNLISAIKAELKA
jgi:hypothetical protein